jgi:hypothetical protein
MRMHVDAMYTYDAKGRMVRVNEPRGAQAPRIFVGRTINGYVMRARADVPETTLKAVKGLMSREPLASPLPQRPSCGEAIIALLSRDAPVERVWSGPAYCIDPAALPDSPDARRITGADADLLRTFPDWRDEVDERQPFVVTVANAQAVSLCSSVRITPAAHAAGVETLPASRRIGMASQAVAEWARAVVELGAVALYSTSWDNVASQAVARRLGMPMFGVDYHVT